MNPLYVQYSLTGASANAIALTQTPLGAGNLTINGASAAGGVATLDTARRVLITGNGNDGAISYTVYGTTQGGSALQEIVAGGNASPYTVSTTQDFKTITRIAVSGATAAAITAGTSSIGSSPWKLVNWHVTPINIGLAVIVTGTVNYTVEYTYSDPTNTYPDPLGFPVPFSVSALASKATTLDSNIIIPVAAVRLTINSGTGSAELIILQAGISGR
jgi:hypothetical protein